MICGIYIYNYQIQEEVLQREIVYDDQTVPIRRVKAPGCVVLLSGRGFLHCWLLHKCGGSGWQVTQRVHIYYTIMELGPQNHY